MAIITMPHPLSKGKKRKTLAVDEDEASYIASSSSFAADMNNTFEAASKGSRGDKKPISKGDDDDVNGLFEKGESISGGLLWRNSSFSSLESLPLQIESETDLEDVSVSVFDTAVVDDPWNIEVPNTTAKQNVVTKAQEYGCEDNEGAMKKKKAKLSSTSGVGGVPYSAVSASIASIPEVSMKKKATSGSTSADVPDFAATASNAATEASTSQYDVSPTPVDEAGPLNIVVQIPCLPNSLLAAGNDMRSILRPLLMKDPPRSYSTTTTTKMATETSSGTSTVATETAWARTAPVSSSSTASTSSPMKNKRPSCLSSDSIASADEEGKQSNATDCDESTSSSSESSQRGVATCAASDRRNKHDQWNERFQELVEYKSKHKNCDVAYRDSENKPLAQWVKRQRYQYGLKIKGRHSNLTDERQSLLESIGFVWDTRQSNWDDRIKELKSYKEKHGHVRVSPTTHDPRYRALAVWLKRQRVFARTFRSGDHSSSSGGMTEERLALLLSLDVEIDAQKGRNKKKKKGA